jgi:hypothetical protein
MIGTTNYWKFVPTAGEESGFASFELTGSECALKTTIVPKGALAVQDVNPTEVATVSIQVNASGTISATAGISLHAGPATFTVTMTTNFHQSGTHVGFSLSLHF